MGNTLEAPKTDKESETYESSTGLVAAASGMQGWRLEMEDAHIAQDIKSRPDHLLLAIFDGHAGSGAAYFAAANMMTVLESTKEWKEYVQNDCTNVETLGKALINAFLDIDVKIRSHQTKNEADTSGCTSVVTVVTPKYIVCANAGDSRCVMGVDSVAKPLSFDHKPNNDGELKRIQAAGGIVTWNRVDGDLAVSRALGDFVYKGNLDLPPQEQKVSCLPDITVHERTEKDDILLLACDGLWDVMSNEEAVSYIAEILSLGETSVAKIAEEMLDMSLMKGSKDNISAVVVRLPGYKLGPASKGGVDKIRLDREKKQ